VTTTSPTWWPPKVGAKLRLKRNNRDYLAHVVAVFRHRGWHRIVCAYYGVHKQWWHYEVFQLFDAEYGVIRPR